MSEWKTSIITYMDLVGIKNASEYYDSRATNIMRRMHSLVEKCMSHGMNNHDHCYIWNDSILLLSYFDKPHQHADENIILREADNLKKKIDKICESYAISVKGKVFPEHEIHNTSVFNSKSRHQPRVVRLKASSYAMSNCFIIEERLGKKLKKPWYVDSRIARKISTKQVVTKHRVKMLPKNKVRNIYVYGGYLW